MIIFNRAEFLKEIASININNSKLAQELECTVHTVSRWKNGLNPPSGQNERNLVNFLLKKGCLKDELYIESDTDEPMGKVLQEGVEGFDSSKLMELRLNKLLGKNDTARALDIPLGRYGLIEKGAYEPCITELIKICIFFEKMASYFKKDKEDTDTDSPIKDVNAFDGANTFGEWLKINRKKAKLTQGELARQIDTEQATISIWENGKVIPEQVTQLRVKKVLERALKFSESTGNNETVRKTKSPLVFDGEKLRAQRIKKGLTMHEVADLLNVSYRTVTRWENGFRGGSYYNILMMADMLDCKVKDICKSN